MESSLAKSMLARSKLNRVHLVFRFTRAFFVTSCALQVVGRFAGIFSCRDKKGTIPFSDGLSKVPKQLHKKVKGFRKHHEAYGAHCSTPVPSVPIELQGSIPKIQKIQIPLIPVNGGKFFVDSILNGRIKTCLMLDTGVSLITLT
ncbi:MAG TPA: hypothetical protein EYP95_07965 [Nitrospinaceae bacterium]|nr:hypothetical protein [Nitrospinaceae bacterium]